MTDNERTEAKDIQNLVIWQSENSIGGTRTHAKYSNSNGDHLCACFNSHMPLESVRAALTYNRKRDLDPQHPKANNPPLLKKGLSIDQQTLSAQ